MIVLISLIIYLQNNTEMIWNYPISMRCKSAVTSTDYLRHWNFWFVISKTVSLQTVHSKNLIFKLSGEKLKLEFLKIVCFVPKLFADHLKSTIKIYLVQIALYLCMRVCVCGDFIFPSTTCELHEIRKVTFESACAGV